MSSQGEEGQDEGDALGPDDVGDVGYEDFIATIDCNGCLRGPEQEDQRVVAGIVWTKWYRLDGRKIFSSWIPDMSREGRISYYVVAECCIQLGMGPRQFFQWLDKRLEGK